MKKFKDTELLINLLHVNISEIIINYYNLKENKYEINDIIVNMSKRASKDIKKYLNNIIKNMEELKKHNEQIKKGDIPF